MIIIQSINPRTGSVTALAEFSLRGEGISALYHSDSFRTEMERSGIYTVDTGKLRPSDGQKFLDALPIYFANSTCIQVIENNPGGPGRADDAQVKWTPPPGGGKVVQGATGPAHDEGSGFYGKKKKSKGPTPPVTTDKVFPGEPKKDAWTEEAREASAAARAKKGGESESKPKMNLTSTPKTPDARRGSPGQKKIEAKRAEKRAAITQQSQEAHKATESAESPSELQHAHELHAAAGAAQKEQSTKLHGEAKNEAINGYKVAARYTKAEAETAGKQAKGHEKAQHGIQEHVRGKAHEHEAKHGKSEGEHEGGEHEPHSNPFRDLLNILIGKPKR